FFELGGHSLLIAQLAAELSDLLDTPVGLGDVFRHPSVRALSGWLTGRSDAAALADRASAVVEVATLDDAEVLRRLRAVPQ
ncbi:MAG TPA: phosphopantetheine-binding protein, partial [Jatrophihabitans sp.]|uniref:phosphopantetheine-binding protein n=1 Tax=Jatrophihabitans sp. TaxID=1932789 RepID=UPI002F2188C3